MAGRVIPQTADRSVRITVRLTVFYRSHPSAGPENFAALWPGVACQHLDAEFFGHGCVYANARNIDVHAHVYTCLSRSHAAAAPWEGQNALDAAFVAYAAISALRQQIKPDQRVHGIVSGRDWTPNGMVFASCFLQMV